MAFKEVVINGVTVRIHRMSAKTQHDIVNRFILPVMDFASEIEVEDGGGRTAALKGLLKGINKYLPPEKRDELLFNYLVSPEYVKVLAASMEVSFCQNGSIQCEALDGAKYIYQIAAVAFVFNFEDFFSGWDPILSEAMSIVNSKKST